MQTMQENKRAGLRLAILGAGSSLVIGSVVWLMISFWPRPTPPLPAEVAIAERPAAAAAAAAAASAPVKAVMGTNPVSRATPGIGGKAVVGTMDPAARAPGSNGNRTPRPLIIPTVTEQNRIVGPLPWKNGPPVRTPLPGAPAAKAPQAPKVVVQGFPGGATSNVRGQTLPYLAPARNLPGPTENGAQKAAAP